MTKTDEASLDFVYNEVNKILDDFCRQQVSHEAKYATSKPLWETLTKVIATGGKRMRPYLVALAYQACGGKTGSSIIQVGAAWELLHQGLLVHDDIIDRDYVRHGQLNVAGEYRLAYQKQNITEPDLSHYASSAAILAGDLALSSAYQMILRSDFNASQKLAASEVMGKAMNQAISGELQDTESVMRPIGETNSLIIAKLKTASYSFVGPLQTGALLAGANPETTKQFGELGTAIGIAFQLKDDLLGLFGDPKKTGKSASGDIREGKRTLLLKYTFDASDAAGKQFINDVVGSPGATNADVEGFRKLAMQTGAKQKVEDLISDYADQAQVIVSKLPIKDDRFLQKWDQFSQFILKRNS